MTSLRLGPAQRLVGLVLCVVSSAGCLSHERAEDAGNGDAAIERDAGGGCVGAACDAGGDDAYVVCECPAAPPGCHYDGVPCGCSHITCEPMRCGRELCGDGLVCCNASCSLCLGPDAECDAMACARDCSPQDARGTGACAGGPGWAWDGTACRELPCNCVGADCASIFPTEADCNAYFGDCVPSDCHIDDAGGQGACDLFLGYAFTSSGCLPLSGCSCVGADCASIAGHSEADCLALHASCPILFP